MRDTRKIRTIEDRGYVEALEQAAKDAEDQEIVDYLLNRGWESNPNGTLRLDLAITSALLLPVPVRGTPERP